MVTKVVLYSTNYTEGLLRELPYVTFYGERGFSHLSSLRDPDTRVVLITPEPPDSYIIDWHLRDLFGLDCEHYRSARERLTLLSPECREPVPLDTLVLHDPDLVCRLKEETRGRKGVLVNFASSATSDRLAQQLDLPLEEGPFRRSRQWGDKASSKALFESEAIPAPRGGSEAFTSMEAITAAAMSLVTGETPAQRVVVKLNDAGWGNGLGNVVIDGKKLRDSKDVFSSVETIHQDWDDILAEIAAGGAIVEEYFADRIRSPSGQAHIDRAGDIQILSTHEQYTVVDQYLGCEFPADDQFRPGIHAALAKVGKKLSRNGVRGTFGVDFICLEDGSSLATEINLRKVGPTHAVAYAEAVVRRKIDPDGNLRVNGEAVYFSHRRVYQPQALRGLSPDAAVQGLLDDGLFYDPLTGKGTVLHILGALRPAGYVETTCFGRSRSEAVDIGNAARASLVRSAIRLGHATPSDDRGFSTPSSPLTSSNQRVLPEPVKQLEAPSLR